MFVLKTLQYNTLILVNKGTRLQRGCDVQVTSHQVNNTTVRKLLKTLKLVPIQAYDTYCSCEDISFDKSIMVLWTTRNDKAASCNFYSLSGSM